MQELFAEKDDYTPNEKTKKIQTNKDSLGRQVHDFIKYKL